jgi:hypothetical protein
MPHLAHHWLKFVHGCAILFEQSRGRLCNARGLALSEVYGTCFAVEDKAKDLFDVRPLGVTSFQFLLGDGIFTI